MNTAIRALIGVGALGGVASGGLLLNKFLSTDNIQSKLEANGFELLANNPSNDQTWKNILTSYRAVSKTQNKLKFEGFDGGSVDVSSDTQSLSALKQKCKELAEKKVSEDKEDQLYNQAKKWCIVPVSVSKLLEKEYTRLNIDENDKNTDSNIWNTKINEHKNKQDQKQKIKELDLKETTDQAEENLKKFKQKCKTISETENHSDKFEEYQENYKTWCSKKVNSVD